MYCIGESFRVCDAVKDTRISSSVEGLRRVGRVGAIGLSCGMLCINVENLLIRMSGFVDLGVAVGASLCNKNKQKHEKHRY